MESKLIHAEIPKFVLGRGVVHAFLAVLVPSVVPQPDIVALINQKERQAASFLRDAHPDFAVHEQTVVEVYNTFLNAVRAHVDLYIFFSSSPSQPVQAQKISIFRLDYMFLGRVSIEFTQFYKVACLCNWTADILLLIPRSPRVRRGERIEGVSRYAIEQPYERCWQEKCNCSDEEFDERKDE